MSQEVATLQALGLFQAATEDFKPPSYYGEWATTLAGRFDIDVFTILNDMNRFYTVNGYHGVFPNSSLAQYHEMVDAIGRDWQSRIPGWANENSTGFNDDQVKATTGAGEGFFGGAHFGNHGAYGYVAVVALNRLFDLGVGNEDAIAAIEALAARHINPNGTIGVTPSLASLNDWFITLGIPLVVPGEAFDNDAISDIQARYVIGLYHPHHFEYFHENVLADVRRIFEISGWTWDSLRHRTSDELESWKTTHQAWKAAWENIYNRADFITQDNAKDFATILRNRNLIALSSIPLTRIDDLSKILIDNGVWGALFPRPNGGDWDEPIESPVVVAAMIQGHTGYPISHTAVDVLYKLHGVASVPASFVMGIQLHQVRDYDVLATRAGGWVSNFVQRVEGVNSEDSGFAVLSRLYLGGWKLTETQNATLAEIDTFIIDNNLGAILIPKNLSFDWNLPISDLRVVTRAVEHFSGVPVPSLTEEDAQVLFGTATPTWSRVQRGFVFREIDILPPSVPDLRDQAAVEQAIAIEIDRLSLYDKLGDRVLSYFQSPLVAIATVPATQWAKIAREFQGVIQEVDFIVQQILPQLRAIYPQRMGEINAFEVWLGERRDTFVRAAGLALLFATG